MTASIYRSLFIAAVLVFAVYNVVPTIGWYTLDQEERDARLERWRDEDVSRASERPGWFARQGYALSRWLEFDRDRVINFGLDLQGGIHMVIGFDWQELDAQRMQDLRDGGYSDSDIETEVQQTVLQQIRRRVHEFEADEPIIQALGANQVQVQLPGEKDIERARALITRAAQLDFKIVAGADETVDVFSAIDRAVNGRFIPLVKKSAIQGDPIQVPVENYQLVAEVIAEASAKDGVIPADKEVLFSRVPKPWETQSYRLYLVEKEPLASGEGLSSASAVPDNSNPGYWQILFQMNNSAAADFGRATGEHIGDPMAIVIDDVVLSAPVIRDRIAGSGQVTGQFEGEEARDLAIALNSGSMTVPVREEFTSVVGASLGQDSVSKGVFSALVGLAVVGVFMLVYYMAAGVIAVISLVLNAVFLLAAMAYFDMTLTLPGVAGLILTIGMAVDANVLIFERIREELRLGHSLLSSIENGFNRATITILDANVTTLIAAAVLYQFGTGPIEGFAVTLSVGVCTSVFSALVISRALFDFAAGAKLITKLPMLSVVKPDTRINFLSGRKIAAIASAIAIVIGVGAFGMRAGSGEMFGVDFTGGTNLMVHIESDSEVPVGDLRQQLGDAGFNSPVVQRAGEETGDLGNQFLIRVGDVSVVGEGSAEENSVGTRIKTALASLAAGGADDIEIRSEQTVGPAVGQRLRQDAVWSVMASLIFIIIYVSFRFELKFAVGAVAALAHDVLLTLGIFALLGRQISMPMVAAVLTIIGYSLNDTIVVFDRVRENLGNIQGNFENCVNVSINQTLARTLLTSLTTLFVVVVLFLFGGEAINDFALALIVGVIAGTYSTIFIASPVTLLWQKYVSNTGVEKAAKGGGGNASKKAKGGSKQPSNA